MSHGIEALISKKRLDRATYCSREQKTEARVFQLAPPCWDHFGDKVKYRPWVRAERSALLLAAKKRKKRRLEDGTCRTDSEETEDEESQIKRKLPRTFHS